MEEVVLVHDEPRIAPVVAEMLRLQGYSVREVFICENREDLERVKRQTDVPLIIRTVHERSGRVKPS